MYWRRKRCFWSRVTNEQFYSFRNRPPKKIKWVNDSHSVMPYVLQFHGLVACQAPLSMEFSRQEYWSELPCLLQKKIKWLAKPVCGRTKPRIKIFSCPNKNDFPLVCTKTSNLPPGKSQITSLATCALGNGPVTVTSVIICKDAQKLCWFTVIFPQLLSCPTTHHLWAQYTFRVLLPSLELEGDLEIISPRIFKLHASEAEVPKAKL